jgi:hypothetical protein
MRNFWSEAGSRPEAARRHHLWNRRRASDGYGQLVSVAVRVGEVPQSGPDRTCSITLRTIASLCDSSIAKVQSA